MALLDLICLANARKRSERCIACLRADGGGWVRLVSNAEHGELTVVQRSLGSAGEPRKFDLIRVEVLQSRAVPGQPENWLIGKRHWELLARPAGAQFSAILAKQLSRDTAIFGSVTDRLVANSFAAKPVQASLALLRPQNICFRHEILGSKRRVRALFNLDQNSYNLSVTDPLFEERIKSRPAGIYETSSVEIPDSDRLFFCVSLGEPFEDGNCYKLVAGVLVLPSGWPDVP